MSELIYGFHPIKSVLGSCPERIFKIYIINKPWSYRVKLLMYQISKFNIYFEEKNRKWLDIKVNGASHQGVIAEIISGNTCLKESDLLNILAKCKIKTTLLLLILDGITDPHNLGACLRSAEAVGVHMVIVPRNRAVHINATVRKVSSGASDRVPFLQVTNLSRTLRLLQKHDIWIVGAVTQSDHIIFNAKLVGPVALVMGSEESGIRRLTKEYCDELINIPMIGSSKSINVSVATGICLFEVLRQRQYQK